MSQVNYPRGGNPCWQSNVPESEPKMNDDDDDDDTQAHKEPGYGCVDDDQCGCGGNFDNKNGSYGGNQRETVVRGLAWRTSGQVVCATKK